MRRSERRGAGTEGEGELFSYLGEGALGEDAARSSQHDDGDGGDAYTHAGRAGKGGQERPTSANRFCRRHRHRR